MNHLVDLIGYVGILLHGLVIVSQSMALGGMLFLVLLARPFAGLLGPDLVRRTAWIAAASALALVAVEIVNVGLQTAVLVSTVDLPVGNVLSANFAVAGIVKTLAAAALAALLWRGARAPWLLAAGAVELAAATLTTHAAARLSDNALLLSAWRRCTSSARPSGSAAYPASSWRSPGCRTVVRCAWSAAGSRVCPWSGWPASWPPA